MKSLFESLLDIDSINTDTNTIRYLSPEEFQKLYKRKLKSVDINKSNPVCIAVKYIPMLVLCQNFKAKNIDVSGLYSKSKIQTMKGFASNCKNLVSFKGPDAHENYSDIESLGEFFGFDTKLKTFDLSGIAESAKNISFIGSMFNSCASIEYIDLSNFNFSKLFSADNAFCNCNSLKRINMGNSDATIDATSMCWGDTILEEFNAPNMILSGRGIFNNCGSLRHINVRYIDVSDEYYIYSFNKCTKLEDVNLFGFGKNTMHDDDYIDLSWAVSLNDKSWKFLFGNMRDADNIIIKLPNTPKKKKIIEKNSIIIKKHNLKLI